MNRILYSSAEVRRAIMRIFSSPRKRRVAITAFVGEGAEFYVLVPKGLQLICWPKPESTNPQTLRKLIKLGAKVSFCDSLHMKVYWSEDQGAVITSANLSKNALGSGNLREIGVLFDPGELDIDRIISSLKTRRVCPAELLKLDRQHNSYVARNRVRVRAGAPSYTDWYESPMRPEWKLGSWEGTFEYSSEARKLTRNFGGAEPRNGLCCLRDMYAEGDWILIFTSRKDSPINLKWMFVDFVVRVPRREEKAYVHEYPYQAVQALPLNTYAGRPFVLDKSFRQAFSRAVHEYGISRTWDVVKPPPKLLDLAYEYC